MNPKFIKFSIRVLHVHLVLAVFLGVLASAFAAPADSISATPRLYHKVTLAWNGPSLEESAETFNDYRLNVIFTSPSGQTFLVPGYFAADGNAAQTSAVNGNQWRAHINPQEIGSWSYQVSFRTGSDLAIDLSQSAGASVPSSFDGSSGSFDVIETNKSGLDFRGKGKLQYVGEHFLQFTNQEFFLKVAANSPEVFLQYDDFDNTDSNRDYQDHAGDWNAGDPQWKTNQGREIVGVVNYLSEIGINENYFLTMNIEGDGRQAYPYVNNDEPDIFDVSKLDQWQIVFDHMMSKGVMAHFVLNETENENWFESNAGLSGGIPFADTRKLYYREMVARFGYLNAITWNIGEENGWRSNNSNDFGDPNTTDQRIAFAEYLDDINPYADHIVVHNNPSVQIHEQLIAQGSSSYTGASFQSSSINNNQSANIRDRMKALIVDSAAATPPKKWVIALDEPFTPSRFPDLDVFREDAVWNTFMLGGAGVGLFIGGGGDLSVQDYRLYSDYWQALDHAHDFFIDNEIPYWRMSDADDLTDRGFALAEEGDVYVVYLPDGGSPSIDLSGSGDYDVRWYNPRSGGSLQAGSVIEVVAGDSVSLGNPPNDIGNEWVVFVRRPIEESSNESVCVPIKTQNDSLAVICL